jgi:rRNA-processing protein FCF1
LKRRSNTPRLGHAPPELVFFLDRCLGKHDVADALRRAHERVELHSAHYKDDELDENWLASVGKNGWIVLTKDRAIQKNAIEKTALISAGVRAFVIGNASSVARTQAS